MIEPLLRVKNLVKHFAIRGGIFAREVERVHRNVEDVGQLHCIAAAATASAGAGRPGSLKPAEATATSCRDNARRSRAAASGLRQMFP